MSDEYTADDAAWMLDLISAGWAARTVQVAAEAGLADHLANGPMSAEQLAAETDLHAPSLHRLLRALAALGVCDDRSDGTFALTGRGFLLSSGAGSLRAWATWWGTDLWECWGDLPASVATGQGARARRADATGFDRLADDPAAAKLFHDALAELADLESRDVVAHLAVPAGALVVDVGGGAGRLLTAILRRHSSARGVVFDLPHAAAAARSTIDTAGLGDRCDVVVGDAFERVPDGGDLYLLKNFLHDWDDSDAAAILGRCAAELRPGARLIVIERVLAEHMEATDADRADARSDLTMLVAQGGRERTEAEWRRVVSAAGLHVERIIPTGPSGLRLIETALSGTGR